jgi:hypothetical protein
VTPLGDPTPSNRCCHMACMSSRLAVGVFVFLHCLWCCFLFCCFCHLLPLSLPFVLVVLFFALLGVASPVSSSSCYLSACFLCGSCSFSYSSSYSLLLLQLLCCLAVQRISFLFVRYICCRYFALVRLLAQVFASWSRCLHSTDTHIGLCRITVVLVSWSISSVLREAGCAPTLEFPYFSSL